MAVRRLAIGVAAAGFAAVLAAWLSGGGSVDLPWSPTLGIRLSFALDGLGALYSLLATGVGLVVLAYSARYLPLHLEHQGRPAREEARFHALILLFMASMVGLATARDLVLLFVFWDLTALASYLLIGFDRQDAEARASALMALLVTGVTAVLLLTAAVLLARETGGFSVDRALELGSGPAVTAAAALILVAGLAKCAQVPLHFWLPRAMAAPTPVSAYLHSAAMVAAGVLLIARFLPLVEKSPPLGGVLIGVGLASGIVGAVMALTRDDLKQILAYSTVAQYGYVVLLLGIGGAKGAAAAAFYVLAHAPAKSALFLAAGAVTEATGERRLSRLGGLARPMPLLAAGTGAAAAGLAALPLTIGFLRDELLFAAALEHGRPLAVGAVALAALTVAYAWRLFAGVFLGPLRSPPARVPAVLTGAPVVLGGLVVAGGFAGGPANRLASEAGGATILADAPAEAAYHLGPELAMAVAAVAAGALLVLTRRGWAPAAALLSRAGEAVGPERGYRAGLGAVERFSTRIHALEIRDLRDRVAFVLAPAGALVLAALIATPTAGAYRVGGVRAEDLWLVLALAAASAAAVATTVPRHHLTLVLLFSCVGLNLALAYAFLGAADVALVAVLVEVAFALLVLGVLSVLPSRLLRRESRLPTRGSRRWRDPLVGVIAGAVAFVVAWGALSRPAAVSGAAQEHLRLAPAAHASDAVTAILADFRGLDTLVEVTVVLVAFLGVATLLGWGRARS